MRILVVSNLYPPYYLTGYELGCRDIVESLKARGHQVRVLASKYCFKEELVEDSVYRWLKAHFGETLDWRSALLKELVNQIAFKRICRDFEPEIVFFFNLTHISVSLELLAREIGLPTCFYFSNNWFVTHEKDHWSRVWPRGKGGSQVLRFFSRHYRLLPPSSSFHFGQAIFTSHYLKELAEKLERPMSHAAVVPWGIDTSRFSFKQASSQKPVRLLYAGQILPCKNIDIAIKALAILKLDHGHNDLSLTIVGEDPYDPTSRKSFYLSYLRDLVGNYCLQENVRFSGGTERENMPAIYQSHDILIFPAVNEGASSLALLEGMSCGLGIVSTSTNGISEVLRDGFNALVFGNEDPSACAQQILRLLKDRRLYGSICENARKTIEEEFRVEKSVDSIERILEEVRRQARPDRQNLPLGEKTLIEDSHPQESLSKLAQRAKKWQRLGALAVLARFLLRPRVFIQKAGRAVYKTSSLAALMILPVFLEAFFQLAGRRRKSLGTDIGQLKRVLVVQLADMGDVLLSGPFLRELRRLLPEAWIGLVIQPAMYPLVEKCPYVDEVIFFRWRSFKNCNNAFSGHILWWLQAAWITIQTLWKRHIDMAISLRWNNDAPQAAALTLMYASGALQRVGYIDPPHNRVPYKITDVNRLITKGPFRSFLKQEIGLQFDILSSLGVKTSEPRLELWTSEEDGDFARNLLIRSGISETDLLIAIAPGAAWPFRRWPADRFIELGKWLQENYRALILIFAAKSEGELARRIEMGLQSGRTFNLAGKTTIRQMAAVLKHCKLFIGNDSGPIHVAGAAGIPVVGLYGPGEYERFKPWGTNHSVIRLGLSCSPCSQNCIFNDPRCIRGITLSQVKEAIAEKLKTFKRSAIAS